MDGAFSPSPPFANNYHLQHPQPLPPHHTHPSLYHYSHYSHPHMAIPSKKQRIDDSPLPPDLGLKPVQLQRRRVWRACEGCRRKKIKCDGREPTCSQCSLTGNTCTWIQTKDRAALSRQARSKAPSHGGLTRQQRHRNRSQFKTGSHFQTSIRSARSSFCCIAHRSSTSRFGSRLRPGSPESTLSTEDELFEAAVPRIKKEEDEENVADQFGQLALDGHGQLRWIGGSSTLSLIEAFHIFAVFAVAARITTDPRIVRPPPFGALDSVDDTIRPTALVFYERSMMLYYIGQTVTQLAHVQTFVLLSSFLASINCLPQAWLLCGQAVRTGQDLGLHHLVGLFADFIIPQRSPRTLHLTPIDKETRRRAWWCVYGLDRMLAVALGRPVGIDDTDCDVELPVPLDDEALQDFFARKAVDRSSPSLMYGFIALTTLYKIAGKVLRSVYALDKCKGHLRVEKLAELQSSVDRLDSQLNAWCEELPDCFKSHPTTPKQVSLGAILCSTYYAILITLHRNFLPTRRNVRLSWNPSSHSVGKAVGAARSCIFLAQSIKDVIPRSHSIAFFIQYLFSAAVIVLLCLMHATDESAAQTALAEVDACLTCLESLEDAWPGARRCKELLQDLQTAAKETMRNLRARRAANAATGLNRARDGSPVVSERLRKTHRAGSASLSESRGVPVNGRSGHQGKLQLSRSMSAPKRARADSIEEGPSNPVVQRVASDNATPGSAAPSPTVETFNASQLHSLSSPSDVFAGSRTGHVRASSMDPLFSTPSPAFDSLNDFGHSMDFIHTGSAACWAGPSWTTPRTTVDGTGAVAPSSELPSFMQYGIYDSPGSNGATPPPADPLTSQGFRSPDSRDSCPALRLVRRRRPAISWIRSGQTTRAGRFGCAV
ncbi:Fungal specific transcription factor domain [Rhizoctonia solani]|uniref:Fungal specific transcription factor domain n=1 Tax=Rhizoctonia solani TaxID=456999 RepID=A0A8H7IMY9_9AGAM|nr:Fungal specific transcription factor domain [Rhizoctonia solani]